MIIGITGTLGSGKDTVAEHLVKKYGFTSIGTGDIVREFVKEAGWPNTRDAQRKMANKLRREKGYNFLVKEAINRLTGDKKAITGIRDPIEADYLNSRKDVILIGVDAPIKMRFKRMLSRKRAGDPQTIDELAEKEKKEMFGTSGGQNISYCMSKANYQLENTGSKNELAKQIDGIMLRIGEEKK